MRERERQRDAGQAGPQVGVRRAAAGRGGRSPAGRSGRAPRASSAAAPATPGRAHQPPDSASPNATDSDTSTIATTPIERLASQQKCWPGSMWRHAASTARARSGPARHHVAVVQHERTPFGLEHAQPASGPQQQGRLGQRLSLDAGGRHRRRLDTPVQAGRPVAGSSRWCAKPDPVRQIRVPRPLVATAPAARSNSTRAARPAGARPSHAGAARRVPPRTMSPPASTAKLPWPASGTAARSAAKPFRSRRGPAARRVAAAPRSP